MHRFNWEDIDDELIDLRDRKVPWSSVKLRIETLIGGTISLNTLQRRHASIMNGEIEEASTDVSKVVVQKLASVKNVDIPLHTDLPSNWNLQIKSFRTSVGWSKAELASRLKCTDESVRRWEKREGTISDNNWKIFKEIRTEYFSGKLVYWDMIRHHIMERGDNETWANIQNRIAAIIGREIPVDDIKNYWEENNREKFDFSLNLNIGGREINCPHNLDEPTLAFVTELVESISPDVGKELEVLLRRLHLKSVLV